MNRLEFKKALIEKCLLILKENFKAAASEMNEAQQAANEAGPPKDRYDPFRSQMLRRRNMFAEQCQKILDENEMLNKINKNKTNEKVTFGSIVITSGHKLFFAIPLGKVDLNGEIFFVASLQTPLFEAMRNKTVGDVFEINLNKFRIIDVF